MKVSRDWLQTFFDTPLPDAEVLSEKLTFHSSEIEEVLEVAGDRVLDVKVLPDKSAWMLSHRGVARELATILDIPLANDPLSHIPSLAPAAHALMVSLDTEKCTRYSAAVIRGVKVGQSPSWLAERLVAIGQRSINNVVDATNYVMFGLGQPLHAFDAGKLESRDGVHEIGVRMATAGEKITTLTGDECALTVDDMVIIDRITDTPIGIAGVKGGKHAEVDAHTTDLIIESANFDRVSVRKTAQRHKLRTDASARYENGVVPELTSHGLTEVTRLITEIAGGTVEGYVDVYPHPQTRIPVSVSLEKINSVLGLTLSEDDVKDVFRRFEYETVFTDGVVTVTPSFERDDLVIPEDLIEEVGRIYGLSHVPSVTPEATPLAEYNKQFIYAEQVRAALVELGFSEVFTSSFREHDAVKLENALASDKGYLRSNLRDNLADALLRNVQHKDLLGLSRIAIFEIGTVFDTDGEHMSLAFGVRTDTGYSAKKDDTLLESAIAAVASITGTEHIERKEGIAEIDFTAAIADLPEPSAYAPFERGSDVTYKPFSTYPSISRDIALWVPEDVAASDIEQVLKEKAGELCVRITLFDEYKKDGRVSYAFRLVFQSYEKTLTDRETNEIMDLVTSAISERGWEVR
jgi:phenylalanyl-tRNA synthetase beta chain